MDTATTVGSLVPSEQAQRNFFNKEKPLPLFGEGLLSIEGATMQKPEILTKEEVFFHYYFSQLIEEQKKTNKLLNELLGKEVTEDVELGISKTGRKRKLG